MNTKMRLALAIVIALSLAGCASTVPAPVAEQAAPVSAADGQSSDAVCIDSGPQTPRDIANTYGENANAFPMAPPASELNLCNIHTHTNAEHKAPGFSVFVGNEVNGGYACNDSSSLTTEELRDPLAGKGAFKGVKPGDTIEVHWVYSSCDIAPGPGLGSCLADSCENPLLRVEAQSFLVVNDSDAMDFMQYTYAGSNKTKPHQPKALPAGAGVPVEFRGSTTGPSYTQSQCSPLKVTWNVRPQCSRVDIQSLNRWAESDNIFEEHKSHGVRQLVTDPRLLAPIE